MFDIVVASLVVTSVVWIRRVTKDFKEQDLLESENRK